MKIKVNFSIKKVNRAQQNQSAHIKSTRNEFKSSRYRDHPTIVVGPIFAERVLPLLTTESTGIRVESTWIMSREQFFGERAWSHMEIVRKMKGAIVNWR